MTKRQNSMKDIVETVLHKEDFKLPAKLLLWSMDHDLDSRSRVF